MAWGFLLRGSSEWPNILTLSYRWCREHRRCSGQAVVGDPSIDGLSHALGVTAGSPSTAARCSRATFGFYEAIKAASHWMTSAHQ